MNGKLETDAQGDDELECDFAFGQFLCNEPVVKGWLFCEKHLSRNDKCMSCHKLVHPKEYHPFFYCELHLAGLLDKHKAEIATQREQARQELLNELSSLMEREETYLKDKDGEYGWYLWVSHLADFINDKRTEQRSNDE